MSKVLSMRKNKAKFESASTTTIITSASYPNAVSVSSSSSSSGRKNLSKLTPHDSDTAVQRALKQLKRLEMDISKFNSKTNGLTKTNILRTSLLPFLRDPNCDLSTQIHDKKIYLSLVSISTNVFLRWWRVLLTSLTSKNNSTKTPVISSTDRNAYLEGISRIISRKEWIHVDPDTYQKFQSLLTITLDYSIDKVQVMKILPLSIAAFVGKVFAYSYYHLPMVSDALLFLLNVKQYIFDETMDAIAEKGTANQQQQQQAPPPPKKPHAKHYNPAIAAQIAKSFPAHLNQFNGVPNLSKKQKFFINSVQPPKHPVNGISDPNGSWVRRWCSSDSDIFNSFFRHYIAITNLYLFEADDGEPDRPGADVTDLYDYDTLLLYAPGFKIILAHILHIFQVSISRISQNSPTSQSFNNIWFKEGGGPNATAGGSTSKDSMMPSQSMNDIYYNSIVKILKTCRDLKFSSLLVLSRCLVKFVDRLFLSIAEKTSIYDYNKNGLLLNIVYEFINHVDNDIDWEFWLSSCYLMIEKTDHIQVLLKNFAFLFNVWDMIANRVSTTAVSAKNAYQLGDLVATRWTGSAKTAQQPAGAAAAAAAAEGGAAASHTAWISHPHETLKWNFAKWLVSAPVWSTFFNHWEPIVRSYYIKLIIWRLIGINNHSRNYSLSIEKCIDLNLKYSYDYLCKKRGTARTISLKPDNPLVNRKFSIVHNTMKEDIFPTIDGDGSMSATKNSASGTSSASNELRKTHPYEIFDEAIYSCSSLPSSPVPVDIGGGGSGSADDDDDDIVDGSGHGGGANGRGNGSNGGGYIEIQSRSSNSLVSSLGKILKILSTDDKRVMEAASSSGDSNTTTILSAGPPVLSAAISGNNGNASSRIASLKSGSATSLTNSIKSGSSSPSIMSSYSTSYTDFSTDSSIKSDSSSSNNSSVNLADMIQPPELLTRPPNIIRPIYRFEIVIDTKAINEKLALNRGHAWEHMESAATAAASSSSSNGGGAFGNSRVVVRSKYLRLPKYPKIPSFAKFYEILFCDEAYINADKELDRNGPTSNIFKEEEGEEEDFEDELIIKPRVSHNPLYPDASLGSRAKQYNWVSVGKSLNEWNEVVEEFEKFMSSKVQDFKTKSSDNYEVYFKRSIPFLSVDSASELKFLNAG